MPSNYVIINKEMRDLTTGEKKEYLAENNNHFYAVFVCTLSVCGYGNCERYHCRKCRKTQKS